MPSMWPRLKNWLDMLQCWWHWRLIGLGSLSELRALIKQQVITFELTTYKEIINKALMVEKGPNDAQNEKEF